MITFLQQFPGIYRFLEQHATLRFWLEHPVWASQGLVSSVLADTALKSLVILAAAGLATVALRRATAATRHLVWFLALASLLVLPVFSLSLPHWPVLPTWWNPARIDLYSGTMKVPVTTALPEPAPSPAKPPPSTSPYSLLAMPATERFVEVYAPSPAVRWRILLWAPRIWALGAVVGLLFWLFSRIRLGRIARASARLADGPRLDLLENLRRQLGINRRVRLLLSDRATMPMTWGILRPVILLPKNSEEWPADRLRAVLLHELAHTRRGDCLTQGLARVACVLYWFNPLVWIAARQLRVEQETACDDAVLRNGLKASEYAENLLQIVAGLRKPPPISGPAIPMIRRAHLADRLKKLLDGNRRRNPLRRATVAGGSAFALSSIVAVAVLGAGSRHDRIVRRAVAEIRDAQQRARSEIRNLYIETSIQQDTWNPEQQRWESLPGMHERAWIESLDSGRWRVDYDPQIARWTDGPRPYSEERYLVAFDGHHFFRISHGYDEKRRVYRSYVSDRRRGRSDLPLDFAWELPDSGIRGLPLYGLANSQAALVTRTEVQRNGRRMIQMDSASGTPDVGVLNSRHVFDPARGFSRVFSEIVRLPAGRGAQIVHRYEVTEWRQMSADAWIPSASTNEVTIASRERTTYRLDRLAHFSPQDAATIFEAKDVTLDQPVAYPSTGPAIQYADLPESAP